MTNPLFSVMPKVVSILQEAGLEGKVLLGLYNYRSHHWNMKLYLGKDFALVHVGSRTSYQFMEGEPETYLLKYKLKVKQLDSWMKEIYDLTQKELMDSKIKEDRYYIRLDLNSGEVQTDLNQSEAGEEIRRFNNE